MRTADMTNTAEPVLNPAVLQQYAQRKTGLLERLVTAYLEEAPVYHQNIRAGGVARDFDLVKINAHSLKSSSANLGAVRLSKLCQDLESSASAKAADDVTDLLEQLGPECFEAEEALKSAVFTMTGKTLFEDGRSASAATANS